MLLYLKRFAENQESTLGLLYIERDFQCFVLEDQYQNEKVYGETRIPEGTYEMKFRKEGDFHQRYRNRFQHSDLQHRGMIELQDVPGFEYILIHTGNEDDDTAGCLLLGDTAQNPVSMNGFVGYSGQAYQRVYPKIADAIESGAFCRLIVEPLRP